MMRAGGCLQGRSGDVSKDGVGTSPRTEWARSDLEERGVSRVRSRTGDLGRGARGAEGSRWGG